MLVPNRVKRQQKCCCGKCHYVQTCSDCCGCIPKQICVSIVPNGVDCSCADAVGNPYLMSDIADYDCYTDSYTGGMRCGDLIFNFTVTIEKDDEGDCILKLTSTCLADDLTVAMNAPSSNPADPDGPGCEDFSYTWSGVSHTCGDTDCTSLDITVAARDVVVVGTNCEGDCANCRCVCRKICVTAFGVDCFASTKVDASTCEPYEWSFSLDCGGTTITGTVTLDDDTDGSCALTLTSSEGNGSAVVQEQCPELSATWELTSYTISVICGDCTECRPLSGCCPDPLEPKLTATFVEDNECPCIDGETLTLTYVGNDTWRSPLFDFCGDTREACDYRLELICPSNCNFAVCGCDDMFLRITKGTDAPYNATYDTSQPCTCDPFFIRFTFSDDECCDGATPASIIGVEITE